MRVMGCLGYCANQRLLRPVSCARVSRGFQVGAVSFTWSDRSKYQTYRSINRIGFDWLTVRFSKQLTSLRSLIKIQPASRHGCCPYQPAYPGKVVRISRCGLMATKRDLTLPLGEGFFGRIYSYLPRPDICRSG